MRFIFGKQDFADGVRGQEHCFLLTNGLGGFCSQNLVGGASRNDHAVLMACLRAPNVRWSILHRLEERLTVGSGKEVFLSSQELTGGAAEEGWKNLSLVEVDGLPRWVWQYGGVQVEKRMAMDWEQNTVALRYTLTNAADTPCTLTVKPWMQFIPKGKKLPEGQTFRLEGNTVHAAGLALHIFTNGTLTPGALEYQTLSYRYDACDGRPETGRAAANHTIARRAEPGQTEVLEIVFSLEKNPPSACEILHSAAARWQAWQGQGNFRSPAARQLAGASAAFLARRASTGGKTILAGYPFFEDWGRDTMIALPGCALATGRFAEAKSILNTFLQYEQDGLMPNLFPEGRSAPMYNTVDAALLWINDVWLYAQYTGDMDWVRQAWPVMERIVSSYRRGTRFGIHMDADGLIAAGQGLDQVTWMDVRIGEILPTPATASRWRSTPTGTMPCGFWNSWPLRRGRRAGPMGPWPTPSAAASGRNSGWRRRGICGMCSPAPARTSRSAATRSGPCPCPSPCWTRPRKPGCSRPSGSICTPRWGCGPCPPGTLPSTPPTAAPRNSVIWPITRGRCGLFPWGLSIWPG